ncbi:MAG: hypothetical protein R2873_15035 [Caldilineaceae bacterium]
MTVGVLGAKVDLEQADGFRIGNSYCVIVVTVDLVPPHERRVVFQFTIGHDDGGGMDAGVAGDASSCMDVSTVRTRFFVGIPPTRVELVMVSTS